MPESTEGVSEPNIDIEAMIATICAKTGLCKQSVMMVLDAQGKMRLNAGFYAPKKHFYGCDRSSWVYARWHCDDITDTVVTFT